MDGPTYRHHPSANQAGLGSARLCNILAHILDSRLPDRFLRVTGEASLQTLLSM